ncbi:hypothetical protein POTOM_003436 [Populus tomentosa]|uniref:Histone deacetylase domain-containing protein n=1 Tax=Populus tomentosa TaxID=118781 RepID=A0A8X8DLG0_POPTO|nr:hypothetical protein POTOM_003436 [Populus tomentosa]
MLKSLSYNLGEDCPVFENLFEFCQIYAGGTIDAAHRLNNQLCDIAINWAGGLHHAKKCGASGFCYINDLVLGILELLKHHARVLVMTVSFHKYGDMFFPGTGDVKIISKVVETYQPGAIVLQCGADSLAGDRLGCFNLSIDGAYLIGMQNVLGVLLDTELPNEIPENEYIKYFAPDYSLKSPGGLMENLNSKSYLSTIKMQVLENLRCIQHAPSVQMQEVPPDFYIPDFDEDEQNPDERMDQHTQDKQIQRDDEYYEGDNDNDHADGS